jgi:hypothetical protein
MTLVSHVSNHTFVTTLTWDESVSTFFSANDLPVLVRSLVLSIKFHVQGEFKDEFVTSGGVPLVEVIVFFLCLILSFFYTSWEHFKSCL